MSSPSQSPSPAPDTANDAGVLTPSRKIQALLARFDDSDLDSAPETTSPRPGASKTTDKSLHQVTEPSREEENRIPVLDDSEDEDVVPVAARSRIAARLEGKVVGAGEMVREGGSTELSDTRSPTGQALDSDDAPAQPLRRRLLTKRKCSPTQANNSRQSKSRSASPFFFPSPTRPDDNVGKSSDGDHSESEVEPTASPVGNSKFLALVEKHRKQRLEREAAEGAKKAARLERLQAEEAPTRVPRGSSPADGSEEEDDTDASQEKSAKKLSAQSRPTRKASKKAQEEMRRETQRMSRNMQLAHQARTKKKVTKDSLLARFNFPTGRSSSPVTGHDSESNNAASSDAEPSRLQNTPPTSPLKDDEPSGADKPKNLLESSRNFTDQDGSKNILAFGEPSTAAGVFKANEPSVLAEQLTQGVFAASAADIAAPQTSSRVEKLVDSSMKETTKQKRLELIKAAAAAKAAKSARDDSDSDLDIVTNAGDKKKYAAFERLPKQKAKETLSHLTLRTLAHLHEDASTSKSMNSAEMTAALLRAARMQAQEERRQKIEELKAKGVIVQTSEEREREQQDVEDLLDRARQEAVEIHKREKAAAKKAGTYSKDDLDDDDSDESGEYNDDDEVDDAEEDVLSGSEEDDDKENESDQGVNIEDNIIDEQAVEQSEEDEVEDEENDGGSTVNQINHDEEDDEEPRTHERKTLTRPARGARIISDDDDDEENPTRLSAVMESPQLPRFAKTPQSLTRSARKQIPGLHMSDDLPIGLTQAFAATMADSQSQATQEQDSLQMTMDLPSPHIAIVPRLNRLDSIDMISDSQPSASQTQPLNLNFSFSQSQVVPESPSVTRLSGPQFTPSQPQFEPTQDDGYQFSPFAGNRFATETPQQRQPDSTDDAAIIHADVQASPILQRRARLMRGRVERADSDDEIDNPSAFTVMKRAAKTNMANMFDKTKSHAREIVDEAAEESDDEYAGLGGASDEDPNEEENDEDRRMIDEDTQVGVGDEAKLAQLYADRERAKDEADVSKLLKDITTGGLRRKRGNDDLDLSDEEDAIARRREAKRREFAKMRRELLKDEAVGKIAEDKKKAAFLKSIEDRAMSDDEDGELEIGEPGQDDESQNAAITAGDSGESLPQVGRTLTATKPSKLNQLDLLARRGAHLNHRPATLAEIRESVSFLIEEPDSQAAAIELGLSDSEEEPEAYVDLDRHFREAEAEENVNDEGDLGDFIVDDDGKTGSEEITPFRKPVAPYSETRAPFSERRTKERPNVVNRLSLIRQASSSDSSTNGKMAFYSSSSSASMTFAKTPSLLRRATTNSSLGSMSGRNENVSSTGVVTNRTERGKASEEKEFVRKGNSGNRNAVNYRPTMKEEKMSARAGITKKGVKAKKAGGFLGELFRADSWT